MKILNILETIFESKAEYFVVETHSTWDKKTEVRLVFCSLPLKLQNIVAEKTIDTITLKEAKEFKNTYIDTNIFIRPKWAPFQLCQSIFYDAVKVFPIKGSFELIDILKFDGKDLYEFENYWKNLQHNKKTSEAKNN